MNLKEELMEVVGKRFVSDDPATLYCYSRTYMSDLGIHPERMPALAVCPKDTLEVASIIKLANKHNVPINMIGCGQGFDGAFYSPVYVGGIFIDPKRMNTIEIDEENRCVTVGGGLFSIAYSGEFRKRIEKKIGKLRPFYTGGPGQSCVVSSTIVEGAQKFGMYKYGYSWMTSTGLEIVLPDGSIVKTGSSVEGQPPFWGHGPKYDLGYLPALSFGVFGIVTKMSFKLYPLPDVVDGIFGIYDDLDGALDALIEISHRELGRGLFLANDWTQSAYSSETKTTALRLTRASSILQLGVALEGTKKRVEYETNTIKQIVAKTGGHIMPRELMTVYRGHTFNILGWAQSNSPREHRHLGGLAAGGITIPLYKEKIKAYLKQCEEILTTPDYLDHPIYGKGIGRFAKGPQVYVTCYGHHSAVIEYIFSVDIESPLQARTFLKFVHSEQNISKGLKAFPEWTRMGAIRRPEVRQLQGSYSGVLLKIKKAIDPRSIVVPLEGEGI